MDASDSGVGAILSQHHATDNKLHPCTFFSHWLSPAESNYNVGNRELLAVVLAQQEMRHWLEGGTQPFIVWTDDKNLAYLRTACALNSQQARWALFLGRFHFNITYHSGSRNMKPDTLSRQFSLEEREPSKETILDPECVLGEVHWEVEAEGQEAVQVQIPNGCPLGWLFVPQSAWSSVLSWGHTSRIACCSVHAQQVPSQAPRRTPAVFTHSPSSLVPHRLALRYWSASL